MHILVRRWTAWVIFAALAGTTAQAKDFDLVILNGRVVLKPAVWATLGCRAEIDSERPFDQLPKSPDFGLSLS
jgi:hypothetical protein